MECGSRDMDYTQKTLDKDTASCLMSLLRGVLQQVPIKMTALTPESFDGLMKLAQRHEVQSMAAYGLLLSGGLSCEQEARCRKEVYRILAYQERMKKEFAGICEVMEKAGLPYMPLKGAVIRDFYPEYWLRTSGDIDILVSDVEWAAELLVENGCLYRGKGSHDITLISPQGIPIELHFQLIDTDPVAATLLEQVWQYSFCREGSCCYEMEPEMLYFYHIAHMAKHMLAGGCGIRYFADIWILQQSLSLNPEKKQQMLRAGGLWAFAEQAEHLSQMWFGNRDPDPQVLELEAFILNGSVFGSQSNLLKVRRSAVDTSLGFLVRRIFLPYDQLVLQYPELKRYPVLLPFCWIRRLLAKISNPVKVHSAMKELKLNKNMDEISISAAKRLFQELELL